jgi:CAS/CSE protein, C-terminus
MIEQALMPEFQRLVVPSDRNQCIVGMSRLLTQTQCMITPQYLAVWPKILKAVIQLTRESPKSLAVANNDDDIEELEEKGYQASFARLTTLTKHTKNMTVPENPVLFVGQSFSAFFSQHQDKVSALTLDIPQPDLEYLRSIMQ